MKTPIISIIITAYNEEKFIGNCIKSLLEQSYKPLEIIIIDDGSTDKTVEIVKKYRVVLLQGNHQGTALARNKAVNACNGEMICFLDADMDFAPDFIEMLVKPILEEKTKGTFSKLEYVKNWEKPLARCWNRNNIPALPDKLRIPQDSREGDDFRAIIKSEFVKVKGFDNIGYNDTWTLHKKLGYKAINATGAVYYHNNPETYAEVFEAAQWIGKRQYKMGKLGNIITIMRSFILFSCIKGLLFSLRYKELEFIPFKIIFDLGISKGALTSLLLNEVKK